MKLNKLLKIIKDRKIRKPDNSYVVSLFKDGQDRIIQKIGEEATEVIIAGKNKSKKQIIYEVSDLIFHLLVLLVLFDINMPEIEKELENRNR